MADTFPPELIGAVAEGRCVLFVGSGLSKHTHALPTWGEFIRRVRNALSQYHGDSTGASEEKVKEYPLEYLEFAKENFSVQYQKVINEELGVRADNPVLGAHKLLAGLPWSAIITTNLDTLLENALEKQGRHFVTVDTEESLSTVGHSAGTLLLLKMHGSVATPKAQVLTRFEYLDFDQGSHAMRAVVLSLFSQFPTLIVGAGLTDPNFLKIYGIAHSALKKFKHHAFYVGADLPKFVRHVWASRKLHYIEVPHVGLTAWLTELSHFVDRSRANRIARTSSGSVNLYLKEVALQSLGEVLHDYTALQQRYLDQVHIPDYGWFTDPWEQTLYSKLRAGVTRAAEGFFGEVPGKQSLLYVAPGPHAPLFAGNERWLREKVSQIWILDILPSVVGSAGENLKDQMGTGVMVSKIISDLTGGCGDALCNLLVDLVNEKSQADSISAAFENPQSMMNRILSEEIVDQVATNMAQRCSLNGETVQADVTYSEMVASFTATPPLMGFRSSLYNKFASPENMEQLEKVLTHAEWLWRLFNDRFCCLHLNVLSRLTKPGGLILVAMDVEKRFDDKTLLPIQSFSTPDPLFPIRLPLVRDTQLETEFMWQDHALDCSVKVAGVPVPDFLAHRHLVKLYAFKRLAGSPQTRT